jgi:hypothetical protein
VQPVSVYIKAVLRDIHLISRGLIDIHGGLAAIMRNEEDRDGESKSKMVSYKQARTQMLILED